jgi:hypothetical protein
MSEFVHQRGTSLALVIVVMTVAALAQGSISYTFAFGALRDSLGVNVSALADIAYFARLGIAAVMAGLWLLRRKRALMTLVVIINAYSTLALLLHTGLLTSVLAGLSAETVRDILLDVILMGISNILIFSVW